MKKHFWKSEFTLLSGDEEIPQTASEGESLLSV